MRLRKIAASAALSATIAGGGSAVAALNPIQGVQAAAQASSPSSTTTTTTTTTTAPPADPGAAKDRSGPLEAALGGLVQDGTLTQAQADAVRTAVGSELRGRRGRRFVRRHGQELLDVASKAIGISAADLKAAVKEGRSIADVAAERGVAEQVVVDALTKAFTADIERAVTDGKLTRDKADRIEGRLPQLVPRLVKARRQR